MKKTTFQRMTAGLLGLFLGPLLAEDMRTFEATPLNVSDSARANASYGLGFLKGQQLATELKNAGYLLGDFSDEGFLDGFGDAMAENEPNLDSKQMQVAVNLMRATLQEREANLAEHNRKVAEAWLTENAKRPEVEVTESGLQYEIIEPGTGEPYTPPADGTPETRRFLITYEGRTLDGEVFERIDGEQMVVVGEDGLPGIMEALKLMRPGATWKLYLKPGLAYGDRRVSDAVGPNQGVIFTVNFIALREVQGM